MGFQRNQGGGGDSLFKYLMFARVSEMVQPRRDPMPVYDYVIQTSGVREQIDHIRSKLRPYKIFPVGRFAEWEYHNMDKAIESAMNCVESFPPG